MKLELFVRVENGNKTKLLTVARLGLEEGMG